MSEIDLVAARFGLTTDDLALLLAETDRARSVVTPTEVGLVIEEIARVYLNALSAVAARFENPQERLVADCMVKLTSELLAEQLASAGSRRN